MRIITLLIATVLACSLGTQLVAVEAKKPLRGGQDRPNVLFIIADDLNTALSGFGHPQCKTPNLDKLAAAGTSFTHAYSQFPVCGPSRASILSGQYPVKNGGSVKKGRVTLPLHFQNHGYWAGRVSKLYHMRVPADILIGGDGGDHIESWTERFNIRAMETFTPGKAVNVTAPKSVAKYPEFRKMWEDQAIERDEVRRMPGGHSWVIVGTDDKKGMLTDELAADKAIEELRKHADDENPFFLAVGFVRPHFPYVAPQDQLEAYATEDMIIPNVPDNHFAKVPKQAQGKDLDIGDTDRKSIRRAYYACVSYMDQQVGRVLDELNTLGLRENTIIVFASDHGYLLGEHKLWAKLKLWEEAIRAPLIISAPGQKSRGVKCDQNVELLDIYPTVTELAGLPPEAGAQGVSLVAQLDDPQAPVKRKDAMSQTQQGYCLRSDEWAYMWYPKKMGMAEGFMLYNLKKDPEQYTNLAMNPEYAVKKQELHERLQERIHAAAN
ncbi:MAG: sulfatase [Coraliomargarita sp.]